MQVEITSQHVRVIQSGVEIVYLRDEISNVTVSKSASMDRWGMPLTGMEYYFYVKINLSDGKHLYLTNLLSADIDKQIEVLNEIPIIRKKNIFSII